MFYGNPPPNLDDDQTDRIGIRTLVMSKFWQPSKWPMSEAEFDSEKPGLPAVAGGVILIGEQTRRTGGALRTAWTFEGINGDGKSVTFKDRGNSLDYGFEPGFAQVDVKLLPNFQELLTTWQGSIDGGDLFWPPSVDTSGSTGSNGLAGGTGKQTPNPMYGVQDFLRLEGTYSFRYAAFDLGSSQIDVAKIHEGGLPGVAPSLAEGRNWLKAPSPYKRRGPVFDITEIYWLSGPGGWPAPIYGKSSGGAGGPGQGLSTGSLQASSQFGGI